MSNKQDKIIKYFIKSSPVGEVNMVLKDVQNIVEREFIDNQDIRVALRDYFEEHRQHIKLPDGKLALVTQIGRQNPITEVQEPAEPNEDGETPELPAPKVISNFVYYDSNLHVKFSFDPQTLEATVHGDTSDFPEQLDEQWTSYKAGVQESVDHYIGLHYKEGTTRAALCFNQAGQLQIDISCISLNFGAFWGGEWQAEWLVDTQNQSISGTVKINNHYFEAGNIQFNLKKQLGPVTLTASDGPAIIAAIQKLETEYQNSIEDMHEDFKENVFKRMRRMIPLSGQKFQWADRTLKMM